MVSGVEFLDGPDERKYNNNGPPLHHFRTHTLKSEDQYLKSCWKECIAHLDFIPHHTVRIYDDDGNLESVQHTKFLEDDDDNEDDNDPSDSNNYDGLEEEQNHYIADTIQHEDNLTSKQAQDNYEASLAVVQVQVLAKHSRVKQQFKEWEQNVFAEHNYSEPTLDDIPNDRSGDDFYKTLRLCKQLLQHWNITLHQ